MVKAILFDFWGTLVENGVWSPTKQIKNILQINLPFSEYVVRMERAMMAQKFDSLKDAFENVCREFGVECSSERMEQLIGMWNKSWMLAKPYDDVLFALQTLKKNYRLVLISNTDAFSIQRVLEKFKMNDLFEKKYFSYEVGMIKTDKNFLKLVLDDLNLSVEECILVGDSLQSDIQPAEKMGMKAVLVDRKESRAHSPSIKTLDELKTFL
jgi:putative hydrolase of the HAD superfamily